jgi:hypothetical protein
MCATGFPDATNTGVPAGVDLTPYNGNLVINTPGAVISGLDIQGTVFIEAPNVTLEDCQITSADYWVVEIRGGMTGVTVQNCTINGVGTGEGSSGIEGMGTFLNNNIYNVENGITLDGGDTLIQGNYIHDLLASGSPHYDGIQIDGDVSNVTILGNTVINPWTQTSAVMIDNYFGPISNITVDNNLLVGGGYTIYVDAHFNNSPVSDVSITNNHMGPGYFGITDFNGTSPVYEGNVNDGDALAQMLNQCGQTLTGTAPANSTAALSDGTHSFTVTDSIGGMISPPSSPLSVTVDMVAPAQPVIASFSPDTGTIGDGIMSDHTLILTGTAEANRTVKVYDGATLLGTAAAKGTGAWSDATGTLSHNTHSFTATDTDAAGNVSAASSALAVTVAANHLPAGTASDFTASHNHGHDWSAWQEFHVLV